jgi:hypothetical protein
VSGRRYLDRCLAFGLSTWFAETYAWDELPASWKDVRRIGADLLVDDSPHHRESAARHGLADRYVVVPVYGGPEDAADPLAWVRLVERAVGLDPAVGNRSRAEGDTSTDACAVRRAAGARVPVPTSKYTLACLPGNRLPGTHCR